MMTSRFLQFWLIALVSMAFFSWEAGAVAAEKTVQLNIFGCET
jgi:hypothetical protein